MQGTLHVLKPLYVKVSVALGCDKVYVKYGNNVDIEGVRFTCGMHFVIISSIEARASQINQIPDSSRSYNILSDSVF